MSAFRDTLYEIQEAIINGQLSFAEIAAKYNISLRDVDLIAEELNDQIENGEFDSDADGYALASAGWGTDEDYVCDNDYFDDY